MLTTDRSLLPGPRLVKIYCEQAFRSAARCATFDVMPLPEPLPQTPIQKERQRRLLAQALTLGTQLAVGMALFAWLGMYVDKRRGGGSAGTLIGIFLGLFYGAYEVWKLARNLNEAARSDPPGPPPP